MIYGWSHPCPRYNPSEGGGEVEASVAKILVVDDEPSIREVVGLYLRRDGHDVISATDGEEALEVFRESEPDLVVLDLMLPKMSGGGVSPDEGRQEGAPDHADGPRRGRGAHRG